MAILHCIRANFFSDDNKLHNIFNRTFLKLFMTTIAMGAAINHPVPDRAKKPSFVIFDIISTCQQLQKTA